MVVDGGWASEMLPLDVVVVVVETWCVVVVIVIRTHILTRY